jgi:gag-polypeptide of LTR copia-type
LTHYFIYIFSAKITDLTVGINNILGCLDLDITLQQTKPPVPIKNSLKNVQNAHARWMMSNRLCLKIMQRIIPESFSDHVSDFTLVLDYLKELKQIFVRNEKTKINILLNKLCIMKYNDRSNVREHILEMMNTALKLNAHKLNISEDILVYLSLNSLPTSFG